MDLTLDKDDQDRIMYLCILDTKFLAQVIRSNLKSSHFTSEIRQKVFSTTADFFLSYGKAPGMDIVGEIESKINRKRIKGEDKELYEDYLLKVFSIPPFSEEMIKDRFDFFMKTRIASTLLNSLLKHQDHFTIDPDRALNYVREAFEEINSLSFGSCIESIKDDSGKSMTNRDFVTKFGIDPIDRQLGGGLKKMNYVIIQGFTGMGKSWCINHLARMGVRFGNSSLVVPTEMSNSTAKLRFKQSFSCLTSSEAISQPEIVKKHTHSAMNKGADIFLLSEEEKSMSVEHLPSVIEDAEARSGKKIDLILLDSADDFLPPYGKYKNKLEENTAIHTFLKNFAKNEEKCVVSTAQVQRGGDTKFWLGKSNIGDNINKIRKATVAVSINGIEKEKQRWLYRIWLLKNSDGAEGAKVWCKRDFTRGQFITRYSIYDRIAYKDIMENEPIMEQGDD